MTSATTQYQQLSGLICQREHLLDDTCGPRRQQLPGQLPCSSLINYSQSLTAAAAAAAADADDAEADIYSCCG